MVATTFGLQRSLDRYWIFLSVNCSSPNLDNFRKQLRWWAWYEDRQYNERPLGIWTLVTWAVTNK